jgi:hypothetical protein
VVFVLLLLLTSLFCGFDGWLPSIEQHPHQAAAHGRKNVAPKHTLTNCSLAYDHAVVQCYI